MCLQNIGSRWSRKLEFAIARKVLSFIAFEVFFFLVDHFYSFLPCLPSTKSSLRNLSLISAYSKETIFNSKSKSKSKRTSKEERMMQNMMTRMIDGLWMDAILPWDRMQKLYRHELLLDPKISFTLSRLYPKWVHIHMKL